MIGSFAWWVHRTPSPQGHRRRPAAVLLAGVVALSLASCTGAEAPSTPVPETPSSATTTPTPSATPTEQPPQATQRVVFGDPWSKDRAEVYAVVDSAIELVDDTRSGQSITLSMFNMTYSATADALLRAFHRGVDVRVLVNSASGHYLQVRRLRRALGTNKKADSWVGVRGGGMRMHSKFMLVSGTGKTPAVVWVSSGNFTSASARQANEALITTGDTALYSFLRTQFSMMSKGIVDAARLGRSALTATAVVQTFPIPHGNKANDPVEELLDNVSCRHGSGRTTIRLAQLLLTEERPYLTDTLRRLKTAGCEVRIVVYQPGWLRRGRNNLLRAGPGRVDLRSGDGATIHTKITTIDGWDAAGNRLEVAMVGTHNFSGRALTTVPQGYNDELSLTVRNLDVVHAYSDWVDHVIKAHSRPILRRG